MAPGEYGRFVTDALLRVAHRNRYDMGGSVVNPTHPYNATYDTQQRIDTIITFLVARHVLGNTSVVAPEGAIGEVVQLVLLEEGEI